MTGSPTRIVPTGAADCEWAAGVTTKVAAMVTSKRRKGRLALSEVNSLGCLIWLVTFAVSPSLRREDFPGGAKTVIAGRVWHGLGEKSTLVTKSEQNRGAARTFPLLKRWAIGGAPSASFSFDKCQLWLNLKQIVSHPVYFLIPLAGLISCASALFLSLEVITPTTGGRPELFRLASDAPWLDVPLSLTRVGRLRGP